MPRHNHSRGYGCVTLFLVQTVVLFAVLQQNISVSLVSLP